MNHNMQSTTKPKTVDIGANLTHRTFRNQWRNIVRDAKHYGVETVLITGTSLQKSRRAIEIAETWYNETKSRNLYATVGVHPHDAKSWTDQTLADLEALIVDHKDTVVAVGECGLDYNRMFSSKHDQLKALESQLKLACRLQLPLFVHERDAHDDMLQVLDRVHTQNGGHLPPVVIHCFTGTVKQAQAYVNRGFFIGLTGTLCKHERGAHLRQLLPTIPLQRLMLETDAPFMNFQKHRRYSVPADTLDVARKVAEVLGESLETVCEATTKNAELFFGLRGQSDGENTPVSSS